MSRTVNQPEAEPAPGAEKSGVKPAKARVVTDSMGALKPASFGFDQARHLLNRAGFGGTPQQVQTLVGWGLEKSVDYLLNVEQVPFESDDSTLFDQNIMRPPSEQERTMAARARRGQDEETLARLRAKRQEAERDDRQQMRRIQHWWLKRMIETPRPLEEKMTLFWHGHFATSYRTIEDSFHMFVQNRFFRQHALGSYADLLAGIIRDPAMIAYLDNNDSRKDRPNENLAREIMELFSLGVGNYSERDIKEGARALTGYTYRDDEFVFEKNNHDDNPKTILGKSGRMDGDDFVKAILAKNACAAYMATKLYRYFVNDDFADSPALEKPARSVISSLAGTMSGAKYEVKPVLRKLFLSEHFYDPGVMGEQIKSPAELVVGAARGFNAPVRDIGILADAMNLMGQNLFFPPNVAGWAGGRSWVNTSTMFVRQNTLVFMLTGKKPVGYDALADREKFDPTTLLSELAKADPAAVRDAGRVVDYTLRFTLGPGATRDRDELVSFVSANGGPQNPDTITGLLLLITAMPEYQLC
jgi:uncharacterized protein (DUF1800 family)